MTTPLELSQLPGSNRVSLDALVEREHRRGQRRRWLWAGAMVFALAAIATAAFALKPRPVPMAARFRTQALSQGPLVHEVSATGHLEATSAVSVGAEVSGRIDTVTVDFNSRVTKGQVLATFDKSVLTAQVAQTRALLAAAKAQSAQAKLDAEQAERSLARANSLFAQQSQSAQEHEAALTAAHLARARVEATTAQIEAQNAALEVAVSSLAHADVRAPSDGVVISRNIEPGQTVASMLQSPVLFTVAADLKHMQVVASVDEADVADVAVGQSASFSVTAWPDRTFTGEVVQVRNAPIIAQDVVSYGVVVAIDNADLALKPGMTASVHIRTASLDATLKAPSTALHFTPPGQKRVPQEGALWLLEGETVRKVVVTPGLSDGELTAISGTDAPVGALAIVDLTTEGRRAYGIDIKR